MEVKQAPTAYFAGERGEQAKRRIKGHVQRLRLPEDLPCYFGAKPIDLLNPADLKFLITQVQAIESDAGAPLGFLVIDTQSRTMGGDENSTKDGAAYAKAIEALRQATPATIWIIAHTGHSEDAQDRPRGSSALLGAYDTFYRHKKIDERRGEIKITVDRDGLGGKELLFTVELYDTGAVNEDDEPVLVPWVSLDESGATGGKSAAAGKQRPFTYRSATKPTATELAALDALREAAKGYGIVTPAGEAIPEGVVSVDVEKWREVFCERYPGDVQNTRWRRFARASSGLIEKGLVGKCGARRWPLGSNESTRR